MGNDKNPNRAQIDGIVDYDLFMIRIKPENPKRIKLKIKFVFNKTNSRYFRQTTQTLNAQTKIADVDKLNYIGLPLNVWLNGRESIQFIINKYLVHSKWCIQGCYRVKHNDKFVKIHKKKWNQ